MTANTQQIETPSGKGAGDENFPVGSMLLPARLRPHVAKFYAFARAIDDIADNPDLASEDKIARLDGFDRALTGALDDDDAYAKAYAIRDSCAETGVPVKHCRDLIVAFKQDAVKTRYRDWDDLIGYCDNSASPVGRYLLDLHGESRDGYRYSDALCNALQVINHLQDCKDDYLTLDRVYLPEPWLHAAGAAVEFDRLDGYVGRRRARLERDACRQCKSNETCRQQESSPHQVRDYRTSLAVSRAAFDSRGTPN